MSHAESATPATRSIHPWRWTALACGLAILAGGLRAFWWEPAGLVVVEERITLPLGRRGAVRIAILTDLHVGSPFNGPAKLHDVVERTNAIRPDVICVLGDLVIQGVIGGRFVPPEQIAGALKTLRAPGGVFAVLGNHDGWLDHDRVKRALEHNAIRVIEESAVRTHTPAGPLWIAGISDLGTGAHDVRAALAAVTDDRVASPPGPPYAIARGAPTIPAPLWRARPWCAYCRVRCRHVSVRTRRPQAGAELHLARKDPQERDQLPLLFCR